MAKKNRFLRLERVAQARTPDGEPVQTLGQLKVVDGYEILYRCVCIELPWKRNKRFESCIPTGEYGLWKLARSPAFSYEHFWVGPPGDRPVPNRERIKVHVANFYWQLEGCIAPGVSFKLLDDDNRLDVTSSERTLKNLLSYLPERTKLEVTDRSYPELRAMMRAVVPSEVDLDLAKSISV
jgi:hypothetical protein